MKKIGFYLVFIITVSGCGWYTSSDAIKLEPKTFESKLNESRGVQLVDVRTPKEFSQGHIKSAININFFSENFDDSLNILNKDKPVYIYCRSGKRSSKSVSKFKDAGFKTIYELDGGILNWRSEGLKTMNKD
ncbi:Rhodanese-related sulfurtransferase [Hyunsoonleella jejuensis]|uniref:Rhodanese-related sulfurtransferase n=1 Tax=Hyunsoonleella jejuensis TaxID=419940 RepID=A0A1H9J6H8_9FLAO|nr:rhodanese-like domain-containing protein [Hyunsoonleella jejuensis]SEQ82641.1 Rhodanese-related sulfurtransferase [Hyunsoonleella jejuensis]